MQLRHLYCNYANFIAITPIVLKLRHFHFSCATCTAVAPLVQRLRHLYSGCATNRSRHATAAAAFCALTLTRPDPLAQLAQVNPDRNEQYQ